MWRPPLKHMVMDFTHGLKLLSYNLRVITLVFKSYNLRLLNGSQQPWPWPKSHQFILKSKWMFVPHFHQEIPSRCLCDIEFKTDRRVKKHDASSLLIDHFTQDFHHLSHPHTVVMMSCVLISFSFQRSGRTDVFQKTWLLSDEVKKTVEAVIARYKL